MLLYIHKGNTKELTQALTTENKMTKLTAVTVNGTTKFINLPVCPTTGKVRITQQQITNLWNNAYPRAFKLV